VQVDIRQIPLESQCSLLAHDPQVPPHPSSPHVRPSQCRTHVSAEGGVVSDAPASQFVSHRIAGSETESVPIAHAPSAATPTNTTTTNHDELHTKASARLCRDVRHRAAA
jgi:hypothetical protein